MNSMLPIILKQLKQKLVALYIEAQKLRTTGGYGQLNTVTITVTIDRTSSAQIQRAEEFLVLAIEEITAL